MKRFAAIILILICVNIIAGQNGNPKWTRTARIAGAFLYFDMTPEEIHLQIDKHYSEGVSVMLIWARVSDGNYIWNNDDSLYLSDVANYTHSHYPDMKVIVYVGPLERQTTDVDLDQNGEIDPGKTSVYTEHPEWLQVGINGKPAVFYGSIAFWIDSTSEDVWLCPNDPVYRQIWINNFAKLAETGIDGVWWDVPFFIHFFGDNWDGEWPCHCSDCETKFQHYAGTSIPTTENWNDPVWRKYIDWRYSSMGDFIKECNIAAKNINPNFVLFNEAWNSIDRFEPQVGFEADIARVNNYNDGVAHEFHPIDPDKYQYYSWLLDAAMGIAYRGIDQHRASWVLNYSHNEEHAKTRCTNVLFTGCNFYEVNFPVMASTVSLTLRTELLNWIKQNEDFYYGGNLKTYTKTAVLYSPLSLSYYGNNPEAFAEEFKGIEMILLESHIPFEVLPVDLIDNLADYKTLIIPDVTVMNDADIVKIKSFVQNGGKVVSTGWTSYLNEDGSKRTDLGLIDMFGSAPDYGVYHKNQYGNGTVISTLDVLGVDYFYAGNPNEVDIKSNPTAAEEKRTAFINNLWKPLEIDPELTTNAPKGIIFNTFVNGDSLIVRVENLSGLKQNKFLPDPQNNINLIIKIPTDWHIKSAFQVDFLGGKSNLGFTTPDSKHVSCMFNINRHKLLIFSKSEITSVEKIEKTKNIFSIGPNPAGNMLNVYLPGRKIRSYKIYNSIGQLVLEGNGTRERINVSKLVSGIYFLKVNTKLENYVRKFIVLKK